MTGSPEWPQDRVDEMVRRWIAGESAGQISKHMGVTRNAAIGKLHRLGIDKYARANAEPRPGLKPGPKPKAADAPPPSTPRRDALVSLARSYALPPSPMVAGTRVQLSAEGKQVVYKTSPNRRGSVLRVRQGDRIAVVKWDGVKTPSTIAFSFIDRSGEEQDQATPPASPAPTCESVVDMAPTPAFGAPVTLMQRSEFQCCCPVGRNAADVALFCGAPRVLSSPYCFDHRQALLASPKAADPAPMPRSLRKSALMSPFT